MKKQLIFLLCIVCLFMVSCDNSNQINEQEIQLKSNKSNHYLKWLKRKPFIVETYYLGGQPANNAFLPCQLDNVLYFYPDGVFLELEGGLKCGISDTADYGFYAVTDTTFYLNTVNIPSTMFNILEFKPNKLRVISQQDFLPGLTLGG